MPTLTIDRHLPCVGCGYDLRGLPTTAACPECGRPAAGSILVPLSIVGPDGQACDSHLHLLAELARFPVDGVLFVYDVVRRVRPTAGRVTVADVAAAFGDRCRRYFADPAEAADLLGQWGLRSSEDVGRVVAAMADVGLLVLTDGRPEDLAGLLPPDMGPTGA